VVTLILVPDTLPATYGLDWYKEAILVPPTCRAVVALIVGAASVPVKVGLAIGAYIVLMLFPLTSRKEVALMVGAVMVPDAVMFAAVAVPVNVGLAFVAYEPRVVARLDDVI